MGLHTDTRIHKTARELFKVATLAIRNMPRDVKRYMGEKIRDEVLGAIDAIYMANVERDKGPHIAAVRRRIQRAELLLQESVDLGFITKPAYSRAVELTQSIGRQATGWLKYSASQAPAT